ncbi:DHHW family protein [Lysinibacillus fusiformis]
MKNYTSAYWYCLLSLFIGGMFCINVFTPNRTYSDSENRMLEQFPQFTIQNLFDKKFTPTYEKYISDQFLYRDFWISLKSNIDRTIGKKEFNGVYLGKNDILLQKFTRPEKQDMTSKINAINTFQLANPAVKTHVMLVPTAISMLKDTLPKYISSEDELFSINQVRKSLNTDINFIDVYPLLSSKRQEELYYKTDHHWTTKGAFYAYLELSKSLNFNPNKKESFTINKITHHFYGSLYSKTGFSHIKPDSIELYEPKEAINYKVAYMDEGVTSNSVYEMENIKKKDKYSVFFNGNHPLVKMTTKNTNGKKLLVIKDSYANALLPFLLSHYSEIHVMDLRYYNEDVALYLQNNNIHEMLLLYNAITFFEDPSITNLSK